MIAFSNNDKHDEFWIIHWSAIIQSVMQLNAPVDNLIASSEGPSCGWFVISLESANTIDPASLKYEIKIVRKKVTNLLEHSLESLHRDYLSWKEL